MFYFCARCLLCQQIAFESLEVLFHPYAFAFLLAYEGFLVWRDFVMSASSIFVYRPFELGGMGGFEEQAGFVRSQFVID